MYTGVWPNTGRRENLSRACAVVCMLRHLGAGVADCRVVELELLRRELYTVSLRLKSAGGRSVCVSSSRGVRVCTGVQVAIASSRRVSS